MKRDPSFSNLLHVDPTQLKKEFRTSEKSNSWISTSSLITASMAGAGILAVPQAINESGWFGIILLLICGLIANVTANLLGSIMRNLSSVVDYSSLGDRAFGRYGRIATHITQYFTLSGVTVIFLILLGILMNVTVPCASAKLWSLAGGLFLVILCNVLPDLKEVKFISIFGVLTTLTIVAFSVVLGLIFAFSVEYEKYREIFHFSDTQLINLTALPGAFSVFAFAFGGHSLLPNFYSELNEPKDWWKATNVAYNFVLFILYIPVAVVGYLVYGPYLSQSDDILGIIANEDFIEFRYYKIFSTLISICDILIIIHLISVLPIVSNPVLKKVEYLFSPKTKKSRVDSLFLEQEYKLSRFKRIILRTLVISLLTAISVFVPYFLLMIGFVTSVSVVCDVYIFPVIFRWKIEPPKTMFSGLVLTIIFLIGITGSITGLYTAVKGISGKLQGNPFEDMFEFTCFQ